MTTEERFERIETDLINLQATVRDFAESTLVQRQLLGKLAEVQESQQRSIGILTESVTKLSETVNTLSETVDRYFDRADARFRRIEENLDTLIRAITAEHKNGKSQA